MKMRLSILGLLAVGISAPAAQERAAGGADPDTFRARVAPFLKQHCVSCHGPEKQKGQIRLDGFAGYRAEEGHLWTQVHDKLAQGQMPPGERPQPADADKRAILAWIEKEQRALRAGGTRRLNRREFAAALRHLTGLSVDYAAALPGDGTVDGFDTGAEGLQDAADSVDQSMRIALRAVDAIRFLEPPRGKVLAADLRQARDARKTLDSWKGLGAGVSIRGSNLPGAGLLIEPIWVGENGGITIHVAPPERRRGVLRLRAVVSAIRKFAGLPRPHLWVEVGGNAVDYREITDQPQELAYEIQIDDLAIPPRGIPVNLSNKVEVPYAVEGFPNEDRAKPGEEIPGGTGLFRPSFDRKTLPPERQPIPFILLQCLEIESDHTVAWRPSGAGEVRDDDASAARLLGLWMEEAWRRPVSPAEQEPFLALYAKVRKEGASFDDALRAAFQSVLLSGPFRYLASAAPPDAAAAQHAIASRLSFMLWGAPPDAELRRLAAAGRLREPAVLDAQVDRLLAHPRSAAFVRPFVSQWLEMGQPITIAMDHIQKQDFRFGRYLKASMSEETVAYLAELFAGNRPARELIQSDWTMMNNILAIHYGYPGIEGGHLRRVKLRPDDPRGGGILGHAGIQSMLCWMGDNWVIYRGAWTLRHILDDPPPPPPLEVPELVPSDPQNHGRTFKQLLVRHQEDPRCSSCHKKIDRLGFAYQNFDLSGRWREVEHDKYERKELDGKIEWRGAGKTRPVDTLGTLPRGEEFRSFAECKERIVRNYQIDLVRGLLKKLMLYGTGRRPDVADLAEIRAILKRLEPQGYPLRDLLKAVVRSRAFLGQP